MAVIATLKMAVIVNFQMASIVTDRHGHLLSLWHPHHVVVNKVTAMTSSSFCMLLSSWRHDYAATVVCLRYSRCLVCLILLLTPWFSKKCHQIILILASLTQWTSLFLSKRASLAFKPLHLFVLFGQDASSSCFRLPASTKMLLLTEGSEIALFLVTSANWRSLTWLRRLLRESEQLGNLSFWFYPEKTLRLPAVFRFPASAKWYFPKDVNRWPQNLFCLLYRFQRLFREGPHQNS